MATPQRHVTLSVAAYRSDAAVSSSLSRVRTPDVSIGFHHPPHEIVRITVKAKAARECFLGWFALLAL